MYKILVADDEPIERIVLTRKINKYFPGQFEIFQAENGRRALEIFMENNCQIAILDIEMPGINGLQVAEKLHEYNNETSIIFLTAFDNFSYARKAIHVRALDYLLKPGNDEELMLVLEEAMELEDIRRKGNNTDTGGNTDTKYRIEEDNHIDSFYDVVYRYIEEHYSEDISLQGMADIMNYADAYFCKLFKQYFNKNFITFLSEYRINKAKKLLGDISINVKDIGSLVGYENSNYFTRVFKRIEGITPSEYRLKLLRSDIKNEA